MPLLLSCCVALMSAFQFGYNTGVTGAINPVRVVCADLLLFPS